MSISFNSTKEDVVRIISSSIGIPQEKCQIFYDQDIDGLVFLNLSEEDLKNLKIKQDYIEKINIIKKNSQEFLDSNLIVVDSKIDQESTNDEIKDFLRNDLKLPSQIIQDQFSNVNGKELFNSLNDLDKFDLTIGQKIKLKIYLNKLKEMKNKNNLLNEDENNLINKGTFISKKEKNKINDLPDNITSSKQNKVNFSENLNTSENNSESSEEEDYPENSSQIKNNTKKKKKKYEDLNNKRISSVQENSKYNVFFSLNIHYKNAKFAVFSEESSGGLFSKPKYKNRKWCLLSKENNQMLFQVYNENVMKELIINLYIEDSYTGNEELECKVKNPKEIKNFFCFKNLAFQNLLTDTYKRLGNDYIDELFVYYFDYFKKRKLEIFKTYVINNFNKEIDSLRNAEFSAENVLYYLKASIECETIPHLNNLEINKEDPEIRKKLNNERYLYWNDINNLIQMGDNSKYYISNLIDIIIKIYIDYDKNFLMKLIGGEDGSILARRILKKLGKRELKIKDLYFKDENDFISFQNHLIRVSRDKNEVNYAVNISRSLTLCLNAIYINFDIICNILEKKAALFSSNDVNYALNLRRTDKVLDNNLDIIINLINDIFKEAKNKRKSYSLIKLDHLYDEILSGFYNEPLNEYYKINKLISVLKKDKTNLTVIYNFYYNVHKKGFNLIQCQRMTIEEIITFLYEQDIFYYNAKFSDDENRDPKIFKYIPINNLKNIEILRKKKVWQLFKDNDKKIIQFYQYILSQITFFGDFIYLFKFFPDDILNEKNEKLLRLINKTFDNTIFTIFNSRQAINEEEIFDIFKTLLILNKKSNSNIMNITYKIQQSIPDELTIKYYFYLLKDKKIQFIIDKIRDIIIQFFVEQYIKNVKNAEVLVSLILLSPDDNFCIYLLNQMDKISIKEEDFYRKENNENFLLFKIFNEKCIDLIRKNKNVMKGKYIEKCFSLKNKIYTDLERLTIKYDSIIILIDENKTFLEKIMVITDNNKGDAEKIFDNIKKNLTICKEKFDIFEKIEEFYSTFKRNKMMKIITLIRENLERLKKKYINELINLDIKDFIVSRDFNLNRFKEESINLKFKYSQFFMCIYEEIKDNNNLGKNEDDLFNEAITKYIDSFSRIINQKIKKESFLQIPYVNNILKVVENNKKDDVEKEIKFLLSELQNRKVVLDQNYIKNDLLKNLINFSYKDKISNLIQGIIFFIKTYNKVLPFKISKFMEDIKKLNDAMLSKSLSGEEIEKTLTFLLSYGYNIKEEKTSLIEFYELLPGKEEAITFLKTIKDKNLDIRNLNEFIDENENSQLQTSDIECLLYTYNFFSSINNNKNITNDETFIKNFKTKFENDKEIAIKIKEYLKSYGEIIQLYQLYDENPEICIEKIKNILTKSKIKLVRENNNGAISFIAQYINQKKEHIEIRMYELNELRDKILMSSTNSTLINENEKGNNKNEKNKEFITNSFIKFIDNLKQLSKTLNSLLKSGYPYNIDICLLIENYQIIDEKNKNLTLDDIIKNYTKENHDFKKSIINGYKNHPFLRLIYGNQFIKLYNKMMDNKIDIQNFLNSLTLNKIKEDIDNFKYNNKKEFIENINDYLTNIFNKNKISLEDIYNENKVSEESDLIPGLYRKRKEEGNYSDLILNILNIYINLTNNCPIINTLLICNEQTTIEEIKMFLYRAMLCDQPILFTIANLECLDLSISHSISKTIKRLYTAKNKILDSYLLIIYEKLDSGLVKDIEKIIPEKNILLDIYAKPFKNKNNLLNKIEVYTSIFAGYGKTTEIRSKIEQENNTYLYLPIGGSFDRDYLIKNLENLKIDEKNTKNTSLHIDLSCTENDELMHEILFNILILKFMKSSQKLFYLGYDIKIKVEVPIGFFDFERKYPILKLFKKVHIDKLRPLRLEKNVEFIGESPISIVAEVLSSYSNETIRTTNIDLDAPIRKSAAECEKIINNYFNVKNQNYYQKTNFIKILALQFRKFMTSIFLNYQYAQESGTEKIVSDTRYLLIKNLIELTKVFTRSPYDNILITQKTSVDLYNKYDETKAIEDAMAALADQNIKQEIFSFDHIKPSLVFFNKDGHSLSIITNTEKSEKEYIDLNSFWNSQNAPNERNEIINYKTLTHEGFLNEIKKVFSLDWMSIDELKIICQDKGNYIFVCDNFIKMVRILLNIEAKIPVIMMGETGVGKTKLIEMLATLYGKGHLTMKSLNIHAGTTDQDIVNFIENINEELKKNNENIDNDKKIWIFFDEINTCNSLGLITEIMCNHTYLGKPINENFVFIGACNPYRLLNKKMRESGLVYYNTKTKNKLNNLVYTVNPLPHALLNFVFDFASLRHEDERKYISNMIVSMIEKNKYDKELNNDYELNTIKEEIIDCIVICHDFIREKYDRSSVSIREINRFNTFFIFFMNYFKKVELILQKMRNSLNMTLYLCYYLRLNDKTYREELSNSLQKYYINSNFLWLPKREMKIITKQMTIERGKGIALNRTLKENLFTCFICIINKIPLIIVGKPGTGKSLSFQILYNSMKGEYSESELFKDKGKLYRYYYQGSESSTSQGILQIFERALRAQTKNKKEKSTKKIITLVFFDEMGLAERSSNNPLKVIHYLLEKNDKEQTVPFLGISNWKLDASKINRAVNLSIPDPDIDDLEEIACSISDAFDENLAGRYKYFFEALAKTYDNYMKYYQNLNEQNKNSDNKDLNKEDKDIENQNLIQKNKDFHGNRDFYSLIKNAMRDIIEKKNEINLNENKILTKIALMNLEKNFGGLEYSAKIIKNMFKEVYGYKYDKSGENNSNFSVVNVIKKNLTDPYSRYLMLISDGNDGSEIIKYILNSLNKNYFELVGSKYKTDIKSGRYSEEILNKIKYIMETNNVLILRDLDIIYPSLYDLFNQNFTLMGDKMFARIAFEYAKISSEVNKNFHCVVLVSKTHINDLKIDPPFLNRFEKHIIGFDVLLDEKAIEIAKHINLFIEAICKFNNNDKLKINLEKMLINCKLHDIEGLIFKIIDNKKNDLKKKNIDFENQIIKEVFSKIAPTFSQDIIAAIKCCGIDKEYKKITEIVFDIYKKNNYKNFEQFLEKINYKRFIIYTFSKTTENIFDDQKVIINKYGQFNKKSSIIEMADSIKSENDLIYLLKMFSDNVNKNLFILKFTENDLNKINSVNYLINNFEKENSSINEKIIILMVHKIRQPKEKIKNSSKEMKNVPDLISFINEEYKQLFIDNLFGKENSDIFNIIDEKSDSLILKEYLATSNIINNKIYTALNFIKFKIIYETKEINSQNYTAIIAQKIINNEFIKKLLLNNIEKQASVMKQIILGIFTKEIIETNDVDFFEVINTKLTNDFCLFLLNVIYFSEKNYVLNPFVNNENTEELLQIEYLKNTVVETFENLKFNFIPPIKAKMYFNKLTVINGFKIPKSKISFDEIIQYVNEKYNDRYYKNEELLRKNYNEEEKILEITNQYFNNSTQLSENLNVEINKYDLFKSIFNQNNDIIIKYLFEDYFIYYIAKYIQKKENIDYNESENLFKFLIFILKIKLGENESGNNLYNFKYSIDEFIKIILFSQGYNDDINNLFDVFIEINKFCGNFVDICNDLIKKDIMKYEISERNQKHTKIVNLAFFRIIESMTRGILKHSIELNKTNKGSFYDLLSKFPPIEANLQKLNKKLNLYSKEISNLRNIIKIFDAYKSKHQQFENQYEKIVQNLLKQTENIYKNEYNNLYDLIIELNKLIDKSFPDKNADYGNLLFYIFMQEYKRVFNEEIKIKLIEYFFKNKNLIKYSYLFISETMKDIKPEILDKNNKNINRENLINNFMNLSNEKLSKYEELYKIYNSINNPEFKELLLYFFENQCQSYFDKILEKYNNNFSKDCCKSLLLNISLEYFKKANQYLYENKNNKKNNILHFYAIAFIKIYCKYYVEVNFNYFENCNFDSINNILKDKNEKSNLIRYMRNIYIFRVYYKKFENFEQFENYNFSKKNVQIYEEIASQLLDEKKTKANNYIFKESFITPENIHLYEEIMSEFLDFVGKKDRNNLQLNFKKINNNLSFDAFYCAVVNKLLSYLYGNNNSRIKTKMNKLYELTKNKFSFNEQGNQIYKNLLNYDLLQKEIIDKISEKKLNQDDFEILLYSLRIVFSTQFTENKGFYNSLLNKNIIKFIESNYIPGFLPTQNEWIKSYYLLKEEVPKKHPIGYYVCKDCGYYYTVGNCTFPYARGKCKNGHPIGGANHILAKKDLRIFNDPDHMKNYSGRKDEYNFSPMLLSDYKKNYMDTAVQKKNKGIRKDISIEEYSENIPVRGMNIITFRILNFIFYSHLMVGYTLNYLKEKEMKMYLIENLFPRSLFGIVRETWILLEKNLNDLGIDNNKILLNMIFNKLIELINKIEKTDKIEKVENFEKIVNDYIEQIISQKKNIEKLKNDYIELNNKLISFNPTSLKEIIVGNFDPLIYSQDSYPDIQYYTFSQLSNLTLFTDTFNSIAENKKKYALINILINSGLEISQNAKKMIHLNNINKLSNTLSQIYSYKIKRDEAKKKILNNEIQFIIGIYNEIHKNNPINKEKLSKEYISPFFSSWEIIKKTSIQYKCRVLRDLGNGEKPLDLTPASKLCYFLVDIGDKEGGMFLASAYENFIEWQNTFIQDIIDKNKMDGILNGYISQLSQEINIQDATNYEIINLNEEIYKKFNEFICKYSMRDIFEPDNKINYKKYNNIIYNYDYIEEELGKLILPGLKKFKPDTIKFVTYLDEGFRGENSSILLDYTDIYKQRQLGIEEKDALSELVKENNNSKFYNDAFASLQILMNEILKSNYNNNYPIYEIIKKLPNYIILNEQLIKFFKEKSVHDLRSNMNNNMNNNKNNELNNNINSNKNDNICKIKNLSFMTENGKKYSIEVNSESRLLMVFNEFKKLIKNNSYNNLDKLKLLFNGENIVKKFKNNEKVSCLSTTESPVIKVKKI